MEILLAFEVAKKKNDVKVNLTHDTTSYFFKNGNGGTPMSFLDQTGLGTFWAKLKNYFVSKAEASAPVTGLTNILTPVNLVPNSNFSRSGGIPSSFNVSSLSSGTYINICAGWVLRAYQSSLSNIIITRSYNETNGSHSLRIEADVSSLGSGEIYAALMYNDRIMEPNGKSYTLYANYTNNSSSGLTFGMTMNGSNSTVEHNDHLTILRTSNGNNRLGPVLQIYNLSVGAHIDITVYDIYMYEGEFLNPPFTNSLDTQPGNQFETYGSMMKDINTLKFYSKGWYRFIKIPNAIKHEENQVIRIGITRIPLHKYYLETGYHAIGSSNSENYASYDIDFGFVMWTTSEINSSDCVMYLSARSISHSNNYITKFRFARSSTPSKTSGNAVWYDGFLEAYCNYTVAADTTRVYADNLLYEFPRMDDASGTPNGDDDILLGSEVTPTMIGTTITIV